MNNKLVKLFDKNNESKSVQTSIILENEHKKLNDVFNLIGDLGYNIPIWNNIDDAILYSVIGQMLSSNVSNRIISNLLRIFYNSTQVIQWACSTYHIDGPINGVSNRKRRALFEWNRVKDDYQYDILRLMSIEEFRKAISNIWGLGNWSADMIAIFYLGRNDVWPLNDSGINRVAKIVFDTDNSNKYYKYIRGNETIVALYFWELINRNLLSQLV